MARLRKRRFFSLAELNRAITELLRWLNERPFKKLEGSRAKLFAELERPALRELPATVPSPLWGGQDHRATSGVKVSEQSQVGQAFIDVAW